MKSTLNNSMFSSKFSLVFYVSGYIVSIVRLFFLSLLHKASTVNVKIFPFRWSMIARNLPGRTDNEIKNHWHTHLKKHIKQNPKTSEVKEKFSGALKRKAKQKRETEIESVHASASSHQILESSSLSPEVSSPKFSSLGSDHSPVTGINWIEEDRRLASSFETCGDFWSEPFVADDMYIPYEFPISPYVSYYDDGIDLFDQVMQELPKN